MSDQWQLYYWPKFVGRAEFVRLMFEEAGVKYEEKSENIVELFFERKLKGYPSYAVPMIKKGEPYEYQWSLLSYGLDLDRYLIWHILKREVHVIAGENPGSYG